jgi:hypothetical protein
MARYKDITLSDGMEVRVHAPPTNQLRALVEKRYPEPPKPVPPVVTEKNVVGKEISMEIPHDPDYLQALAEWQERDHPAWEALIAEETDRRGSLFVFKDLEVPDDWDVEAEVGAIVRLDEPDWEPTPGELGRKRDYIQWVILADPEDALLVQSTLLELTGIPKERVEAYMASFRNSLEGETPQ